MDRPSKDKGGRLFLPDERNAGGKNEITDRMLNHQAALLSTKPSISTRNPPHPHVDVVAGKQFLKLKLQKYNEFNEVFQSAKKAASAKPYIDTSAPKSLKAKKLIKNKRVKEERHINLEHSLNLLALERKLKGVGSAVERKKNAFDPIAYPARFFRRSNKRPEDIDIDYFHHKVIPRSEITANNSKLASKIDQNTEAKKSQVHLFPTNQQEKQEKTKGPGQKPRASSAVPKQTREESKEENHLVILREHIPRVQGSTMVDIEHLRVLALHTIIDNRIYTDKHLFEFFELLKEANPQIETEYFEKMLLGFVEELDS